EDAGSRPKTYPESLQNFLNQVYNNKVTVINRGYSGDGTKAAYNRWITSSEANLTTINLGVNDSRASWVDYAGNLVEFLKYYRKLIERELDWNSAVIILLPPKMKNSADINVSTFANALYDLGSEYGINVIETDIFLANYSADIYSDDTHLNGKGYEIYGAKLSSLFVGEGAHKPMKVSDGTTLLTRKTIDNIVFINNAFAISSEFSPTPDEIQTGKGIHLDLTDKGSVIYSFYCEQEDTVLIPSLYANDNTISFDLTLDFGVEQPRYSIDWGNNQISRAPSVVNFPRGSFTGQNKTIFSSYYINSLSAPYIRIPTKGWHTVKITANRPKGVSLFYGLNFLSYDSFETKVNGVLEASVRTGYYKFHTHTAHDSGADVLNSIISLSDITTALKLNLDTSLYWKNIPLKLTVYNYDQNVLEYVFIMGGTNDSYGHVFGKDVRETKILATPNASLIRACTGFAYDKTTKQLTFNWSGATTRASTCTITVL
ncbi:SGNH/GDSL hydrolase family protein, partial [Bacillus mycoides]|uniref:SGNH/GDSL hydrolase family protein n=2 Tax=Bacillus mycoides TaxID=1405 RepID=UPI003D23AD43